MPVMNLVYSGNLQLEPMLDSFLPSMHALLVDTINTDLRSCRTVISKAENYYIGDGDAKNAFIHLYIAILPGRAEELRHELGKVLYDKITHDFADALKGFDMQIRVILRETDTNHYYGLGAS